ncbi:MAG: GHKL domain-containing protein [Streptococcus sp.]
MLKNLSIQSVSLNLVAQVKERGRGIGLSTVREILGKYPNCSLSTQSKDYRFKQTLKIEDVVLIMTKKRPFMTSMKNLAVYIL